MDEMAAFIISASSGWRLVNPCGSLVLQPILVCKLQVMRDAVSKKQGELYPQNDTCCPPASTHMYTPAHMYAQLFSVFHIHVHPHTCVCTRRGAGASGMISLMPHSESVSSRRKVSVLLSSLTILGTRGLHSVIETHPKVG